MEAQSGRGSPQLGLSNMGALGLSVPGLSRSAISPPPSTGSDVLGVHPSPCQSRKQTQLRLGSRPFRIFLSSSSLRPKDCIPDEGHTPPPARPWVTSLLWPLAPVPLRYSTHCRSDAFLAHNAFQVVLVAPFSPFDYEFLEGRAVPNAPVHLTHHSVLSTGNLQEVSANLRGCKCQGTTEAGPPSALPTPHLSLLLCGRHHYSSFFTSLHKASRSLAQTLSSRGQGLRCED